MNGFFQTVMPQNDGPAPPAGDGHVDPAGFFESFGAAWRAETVREDSMDYTRRIRSRLGLRMFSMLPEDAKQRVADRNENGYEPGIDFAGIVAEEAAKQVGNDPTTWAGYPLNGEQVDAYILRQKAAVVRDAQAVLDRPGGGFGEFLGAASRDLVDEFNIITAPFGVQGGALKTIFGEALLGGVSNVARLPIEQQVADQLGEPRRSGAERFAEGAALAGGFTAFLQGVARFLHYRSARRSMTRDGTPAGMSPDDHEADVGATYDRATGAQTPRQALFDQKTRVASGVPAMSDFDFSAAGNASPRTNRVGYVYGKLLSMGYAPEDASALVGNFMVESGPALHPGAVGDGGNALGIAQWNGPRMRALEEFARKRGMPADDLDTQIAFLDQELKGTEASAFAAIRRAGTAEEKAALVSDLFERPGIPHRDQRVGFARALQEQFNSGRIPRWEGGAPDLSAEVPRFTTSRGYTGEGQIGTASGRRIDVRYEVIDASLLKRATGDLQPRDRSRAASDAWIKDTAARLDPAQLMPSPNAATGTPIVGPDNVIESGNGRFGAITHAYEHFPDRGDAYRQSIESFTGQPIPAGIERPVLVARRTTDLTAAERRDFAVDAQDAGVMRMSAPERANVAAGALTPDMMARFDPATDMFDPANAHVVRAMFDVLPRAEHNAMTDGARGLSAEGRAAIRQAVFARAWPAADMIGRFIEGEPGELKSLMTALDQAAPHWAALRAEIEAGRVRADADISPFVLEAMRLIAAARDGAARDGRSVAGAVADMMNSADLMEGALSPVTLDLLTRKFWKEGRAAGETEITDFLTRYATEARKVATTEVSLLDAPTTAAILRRIDPAVFRDLPEEIGAPRDVALRGQAPESGPPMAETAFAKGADSPEAEAGDTAALEGLGVQELDHVRPVLNLAPGMQVGRQVVRDVNSVPLYRDASAPATWDMIKADIVNRSEAEGIGQKFFAADPDLAIGQHGNTGVVIKVRQSSLAVEPHAKLGAQDTEWVAWASAPRAIDEIVVMDAEAATWLDRKVNGIWRQAFDRNFEKVSAPSFSRIGDTAAPVNVYRRRSEHAPVEASAIDKDAGARAGMEGLASPVAQQAAVVSHADYEFTRAIAEARANVGDMTVTLGEGIKVRAADLLDQIEEDQGLVEYLNFCNPGGQS